MCERVHFIRHLLQAIVYLLHKNIIHVIECKNGEQSQRFLDGAIGEQARETSEALYSHTTVLAQCFYLQFFDKRVTTRALKCDMISRGISLQKFDYCIRRAIVNYNISLW